MESSLSPLEEFDTLGKIENPHLFFAQETLSQKINLAYFILARKKEEVLLISPLGLKNVCVAAGLSLEHIEYLAKNGPQEYKEVIWKTFSETETLSNILNMAKAMDEDEQGSVSKNQERIKTILQYLKDNELAFRF